MDGDYLTKILAKQNKKIYFLEVEDIIWFESSGNYVKVHLENNHYLIRASLSSLEEKLNPRKFIRVHNTTIVNVDKIKVIERWFTGDFEITLDNSRKLKMSRNYRDVLNRFS